MSSGGGSSRGLLDTLVLGTRSPTQSARSGSTISSSATESSNSPSTPGGHPGDTSLPLVLEAPIDRSMSLPASTHYNTANKQQHYPPRTHHYSYSRAGGTNTPDSTAGGLFTSPEKLRSSSLAPYPSPSSPGNIRRRPSPLNLSPTELTSAETLGGEGAGQPSLGRLNLPISPNPTTPSTSSSLTDDKMSAELMALEGLGRQVRGNLMARPPDFFHRLTMDEDIHMNSPSEGSYLSAAASLVPTSIFVSPSELSAMLSSYPLILDIREALSFNTYRIPTSLNLVLPLLIIEQLNVGKWHSDWKSLGDFVSTQQGRDTWNQRMRSDGFGLQDNTVSIVIVDHGLEAELASSLRGAIIALPGVSDAKVFVLGGGISRLRREEPSLLVEGTEDGTTPVQGEKEKSNSIPKHSLSLDSAITFPSSQASIPRGLSIDSFPSPPHHITQPLLSPTLIAATSQPSTSPSFRRPPPLKKLSMPTEVSTSGSSFSSEISYQDPSPALKSAPVGDFKSRAPKLSIATSGPQHRYATLDVPLPSALPKKKSMGLLIQTNFGRDRSVSAGASLGSAHPHSYNQSKPPPLPSMQQQQPPPTPGFGIQNISEGSSSSSFSNHPTSNAVASSPFSRKTPPVTPLTSRPTRSRRDSYPPPSESPGHEQFVISTILPGFLYLGPEITTSSEVDQLSAFGIKRILNMAVECEDDPSLGLRTKFEKYVRVPMRDNIEEQGVGKGIREACSILDDARLHDAPIYVHCRAGKSRSVTVVLGYLIHAYRWPLQKAYDYVFERRKGISPNIGFWAELMLFESSELGGKGGARKADEDVVFSSDEKNSNGVTPAGHSLSATGRPNNRSHLRESLPPQSAGLLDFGSSPYGAAEFSSANNTEVKKNGQYVHARKPMVDESSLAPMRRVSKAGLETVGRSDGGYPMLWESSSNSGVSSPTSPATPIAGREGWL